MTKTKSSKKSDIPELIEILHDKEDEESQLKESSQPLNSELIQAITELVNKFGQSKVQEAFEEVRTASQDKNEPILDPKNQQFTAFPIKYPAIWKLYKEQEACKWTSGEIDFSNDYDDYLSLNKDEQHYIDHTLAFFAASDGIVNFNLNERFTRDIQIHEAQFAYQFQMSMENVHSETYSLMLDNIIKEDSEKKDRLFNAITTIPAIKLMADYAFKWIQSSKSFAHRIIAFAIIEGVFFSGAFASIFWLKKYRCKGKDFMVGLIKSNELIARDEGLHCTFACELYSMLNTKLEQDEIFEMMKEGVDIAKNFSTKSIPVKLIGMNNDIMCDYLEYIGDRMLNMLGYKKLYKTKNPLKFIETIGLSNKANFFESRPTQYQDPHVMNKSKNKKKLVIKNTMEYINALDF